MMGNLKPLPPKKPAAPAAPVAPPAPVAQPAYAPPPPVDEPEPVYAPPPPVAQPVYAPPVAQAYATPMAMANVAGASTDISDVEKAFSDALGRSPEDEDSEDSDMDVAA